MTTQLHKVKHRAREYLPPHVPTGQKLQVLLSKLRPAEGEGPLSKAQREVLTINGELRWMVKRLTRILRGVHCIACVAARPPVPDAMYAALGLLVIAFDHKAEGWSHGGTSVEQPTCNGFLKGTVNHARRASVRKADAGVMSEGAPSNLMATSDTTWSLMADDGETSNDLVTVALLANGALVQLELKKAGLVTGSSAELEGLGLLKATDRTMRARQVWGRLGGDIGEATPVLCDAEAALRAAAGESSVQRLRHALRRSAIVTQRVRAGEISLVHVPDAANVVDMFTKWVSAAKVENSLAYLTGSMALRAHGGETTVGETAGSGATAATGGTVMLALLASLEGSLAAMDSCLEADEGA